MNAMTIKELIEKLRKEYGAENGCYKVLQYYVETSNKLYSYAHASGFINGLYAVNYINDEEHEMLTNELIEISKQRA